MKYSYKIMIWIFTILSILWHTSFAEQLQIPGQPTIYTDSEAQYLDASKINDPIRDWAYSAIKNPGNSTNQNQNEIMGIQWIDNQITNHKTAETRTLKYIYNIINFALAWLSLVALIYLIYHWMIVLTAAGDDARYKEGIKGIKYATIAILGIGLSWIFVSSIFRLVNWMATGKRWI